MNEAKGRKKEARFPQCKNHASPFASDIHRRLGYPRECCNGSPFGPFESQRNCRLLVISIARKSPILGPVKSPNFAGKQ